MDYIRVAKIRSKAKSSEALRDAVAQYLPSNYAAGEHGEDDDGQYVVIAGQDNAGWTLHEYVLPRLASGLYFGVETHGE